MGKISWKHKMENEVVLKKFLTEKYNKSNETKKKKNLSHTKRQDSIMKNKLIG